MACCPPWQEFVLTWEKLDDAIAFSHAHREEKANPEQQQHLVDLVVKLYNECSRSTLINSRNLCDHSYKWLADPSYYPSEHGFPKQIPARPFTSVYTELAAIRKRMIEELDVVKFAMIPAERAQYFERDDLFGASFHKQVPSESNAEIRAAGNCLAMDLNTAAVFHLMRAVELGLRKFVAYLQSKGIALTIT